MADYVLLHNPRCSKSRAALALLAQHGIQPRVRRYLDEPLSIAELSALHAALGVPVRDMLRRDETDYRDQGLADPTLDDAALLAAIAQAPVLLQRPILQVDGRAVIGRPPEQVLTLL